MKKTLKPFVLIAGIALTLISTSCINPKKNIELADTIDEGTIEYSLFWPKKAMDSGLSFILPKKISMSFNRESQRYVANGAMDLFSLQLIKSSTNDTLFTLLEAISQKTYTTTLLNQEMNWTHKKRDWKTVVVGDSTKTIQELECTKALLFEPNAIGPSAVVWFTERISAKDIYKETVFEQIPGVIMEIVGNYDTHYFTIKASSVVEKEIPTSFFNTPPEGFQLVEKEEIEERLRSIFK